MNLGSLMSDPTVEELRERLEIMSAIDAALGRGPEALGISDVAAESVLDIQVRRVTEYERATTTGIVVELEAQIADFGG
jgi:hypothetical protein